jgi:hypothetical protein
MYAPVMGLTNSRFVPKWYENFLRVATGGRGGAGAAPGATPPPPPPPCKANGK